MPSHDEVERAIRSVPGVAEAAVARAEDTGRGRLRIRLHPGEDAERVSWSVAATLRERFGIALDPEEIRPRLRSSPATAGDESPTPDAADEPVEHPGADPDGAEREPAPDTHRVEAPATVSAGGPVGATHDEPTPDDLGPEAPREHVPTGGEPTPSEGERRSSVATTPRSRERPVGLAAEHIPPDRSLWRAAIRNLASRNDGGVITVVAGLELDGRTADGEARGAPTTRGLRTAIAEATVRAMGQLTHAPLRAQVDRVTVGEADPASVTVIVSLLSGRGEELLLGGSIVRGDVEHAIMRATLDALNRRVQPDLALES